MDKVILGGPTNANEGILVAYTITAKPGASGAYFMGMPGWELGSQPESCTGGTGRLVAGNGQPNYVHPGSCISYSQPPVGSAQLFFIPGVSYSLYSDKLYYKIVGVTNSTQ